MSESGQAREPDGDLLESIRAAAARGARTVTSNPQDSEDAASETVRAFLGMWARGMPPRHPRTWARVVGANMARHTRSKRHRERPLDLRPAEARVLARLGMLPGFPRDRPFKFPVRLGPHTFSDGVVTIGDRMYPVSYAMMPITRECVAMNEVVRTEFLTQLVSFAQCTSLLTAEDVARLWR